MRADKEFTFEKKDFDTLSGIVYDQTGIVLKDHKFEMVYGRLARRLRALNLDRFDQYVERVQGSSGDEELAHLIDAITTNLTKFFREDYQFRHLGEAILRPAMAASQSKGSKTLRIWSAGCSGGQEAYTIAMLVASIVRPLQGWDIKILATDIDRKMLSKGRDGIYTKDEASSIPETFRKRFVTRYDDGHVMMSETLKNLIHFKPLNLLHQWPFKQQFDVIFCRNVVIYFDDSTKKRLIHDFCQVLKAGGHLYLGHSEALMGNVDALKGLGRSCFQKWPAS